MQAGALIIEGSPKSPIMRETFAADAKVVTFELQRGRAGLVNYQNRQRLLSMPMLSPAVETDQRAFLESRESHNRAELRQLGRASRCSAAWRRHRKWRPSRVFSSMFKTPFLFLLE